MEQAFAPSFPLAGFLRNVQALRIKRGRAMLNQNSFYHQQACIWKAPRYPETSFD